MNRYSVVYMTLILTILILGTQALAGGIKDRMLQRQPAVLELKNKGVVGEANTGYLGFVSSARTGQDVVSAENQDRKAIYSKIAQQQNLSVDLVAKRRAQQLIDRTSPGHYYQNASGAWVKK